MGAHFEGKPFDLLFLNCISWGAHVYQLRIGDVDLDAGTVYFIGENDNVDHLMTFLDHMFNPMNALADIISRRGR